MHYRMRGRCEVPDLEKSVVDSGVKLTLRSETDVLLVGENC